MDTVISLRRPREYSMAEGARFEVHLTKARGIVGDDARPFEANLITEGNALHWRIRELEDVELAGLKRLLAEGYSIRDCAEEMGKSKAAVQRLKKKLERDKLYLSACRCTAVPVSQGRAQRYTSRKSVQTCPVLSAEVFSGCTATTAKVYRFAAA